MNSKNVSGVRKNYFGTNLNNDEMYAASVLRARMNEMRRLVEAIENQQAKKDMETIRHEQKMGMIEAAKLIAMKTAMDIENTAGF
jgi:hypothetical protein